MFYERVSKRDLPASSSATKCEDPIRKLSIVTTTRADLQRREWLCISPAIVTSYASVIPFFVRNKIASEVKFYPVTSDSRGNQNCIFVFVHSDTRNLADHDTRSTSFLERYVFSSVLKKMFRWGRQTFRSYNENEWLFFALFVKYKIYSSKLITSFDKFRSYLSNINRCVE